MKSVYEEVPVLENEKYLLSFVKEEDAGELLKIYSDKKSLPFFNSDNCHGDNFYYQTIDRMNEAVKFWLDSYKSKWFVRWTIIEKASNSIIGSIELFHREAEDYFNHTAILRLDCRKCITKINKLTSLNRQLSVHSKESLSIDFLYSSICCNKLLL